MIKTLVYTYEKRDLLKKEFLNKLDSIWGNWYICPWLLREFSAFVCLFGGRSECRQWLLLLVIRRNNFLSVADMRSSMVNDWLQTPLLRALWNKLSRRSLSAFDNCPANDSMCVIGNGSIDPWVLDITGGLSYSGAGAWPRWPDTDTLSGF